MVNCVDHFHVTLFILAKPVIPVRKWCAYHFLHISGNECRIFAGTLFKSMFLVIQSHQLRKIFITDAQYQHHVTISCFVRCRVEASVKFAVQHNLDL